MPDRPITDHDELIKKEGDLKFRPVVSEIFEGQERVYQKLDKLEKLILSTQTSRAHTLINSLFIAGLYALMLLFRGCK